MSKILFSQQPDAIVKMFTKTNDWALSQKRSPPIIVNRQLCVANAFEEFIHEKYPEFHHKLRSFYDQNGYPLAKKI